MENYAKAPQSITEIRSDKTGKSEDWTPRDALIATLREIDSGEFNPDKIIIVWNEPINDDKGKSGSRLAGKGTTFEHIGLLYRALHVMQDDK